MFEIKSQREGGRGNVMIAKQDILPGTELYQEVAILHNQKTDSVRESYSQAKFVLTGVEHRYWDALFEFNKLSEKIQMKILNLHCPTSGPFAANFREKIKKLPMSSGDTDTFLKLSMVLNMNMYGVHRTFNIFEKSSCQSHSCLPNCAVLVKGDMCYCRVILPVKAGEELTNCFNHVDYFDKPIHVRRDYYLLTKEFYCRCVRCEGPGDDTRQFDCHDAKCTGQHWTCQPNSQAIPYLLPCTVCGKVPPEDFQQEMFEIEKQLPAMSALATQVRMVMCDGPDGMSMQHSPAEKQMMLQRVQNLKFPVAHSKSSEILSVLTVLHSRLPSPHPVLLAATKKYIAPFERMFTYPSDYVAANFSNAAYATSMCDDMPEAMQLSKQLSRRAMQMIMVFYGRQERIPDRDELLLETLTLLAPEPVSLTECAFCGESPDRAAITLSRCGKCKNVCYCCGGCQKAHWPLHKKTCKVVK